MMIRVILFMTLVVLARWLAEVRQRYRARPRPTPQDAVGRILQSDAAVFLGWLALTLIRWLAFVLAFLVFMNTLVLWYFFPDRL